MRSSSTTSRVTLHSLPSFSIPVTPSIGRPISSWTCRIAPITISLGERSSLELLPRLLPEDRCCDFDDEPPLVFDDEPPRDFEDEPPLDFEDEPLDFDDELRLELLLLRLLDSAMVKPLLAHCPFPALHLLLFPGF